MLALLNVPLTQKNHWIIAETEWTPWFFSVNIVELFSWQEFPAAHWSSPFRSFWGMGFGKLGHNLLRGYSPNTENFTQVSRFFRWNDRAREVAGSIFTSSAPTTLTASRDFFRTRGKGFFHKERVPLMTATTNSSKMIYTDDHPPQSHVVLMCFANPRSRLAVQSFGGKLVGVQCPWCISCTSCQCKGFWFKLPLV